MQKVSFGSYLLLLVAFLIYSSSGVFSKLASENEFLSMGYFKYFTLLIASMATYAVLWQIILKRFQLTQAFLCKSITVVFSLMFAHLFFSESISSNNIIGATLIVTGIVINSQSRVFA